MSQELIRSDRTELAEIEQLGELMKRSRFFADVVDMAQAAVKIMAGRELGIPPVAAMMGIHIIKGKIGLGAHLIASRIRAHGYDYRVKRIDDAGCDIEFLGKPAGNGSRVILGSSSFGSADADKAQIKSDMYRKFPRNMYYSRAISNGAKWYCPEVFGGAPIYTPEELGEDQQGDTPIDVSGIETGGAPVGTKEAAQNVAKRKVRELAAAKAKHEPPPAEEQPPPLEPTPTEPPMPLPWSDMSQMFERFGECKEQLGEPRYRAILAEHSITSAAAFKSLYGSPIPAQIYREMMSEIEAKMPVEEPPEPPTMFERLNALAAEHKLGPMEASAVLAKLGFTLPSQVPESALPVVAEAFREYAQKRGAQ